LDNSKGIEKYKYLKIHFSHCKAVLTVRIQNPGVRIKHGLAFSSDDSNIQQMADQLATESNFKARQRASFTPDS
jgi:hypothetical protein